MQQLAGTYQFLIISNRADVADMAQEAQFTVVHSGPKGESGLALAYWYDFQLPGLLKKNKAGYLFALDGLASLRSPIPQSLFVTDLAFTETSSAITAKQRSVYKKRTASGLKKAGAVIAASQFTADKIKTLYAIPAQKISVLYPYSGEPAVIAGWQEKEKLKDRFAGGKEYFLFTGDIDGNANLYNLLKAFSIFKKRQKTNMMLLIAGEEAGGDKKFTKDLATYKYREDVRMINTLPEAEQKELISAAYAFVYPVLYSDFAAPVATAMAAGVPVLASNDTVFPELCGAAAVFADPHNINDIAMQMMLLFKDEDARASLVSNGISRAQYISTAAGVAFQDILPS